MLKYFTYIILLIVFVRCEQVVNLDLPKGNKRLVIEGMITNQPGPYTVKLTKTKDYAYTYNDTVLYEKGAQVIIRDNMGNVAVLKEVNPGIYQTDSSKIRGEIGRSYVLEVNTKDGRNFKSHSELLMPVPAIDSIFYILDFNTLDAHRNPDIKGYIAYQDDPDAQNNYLIKRSNIFGKQSIDHIFVSNDKDDNGRRIIKQITGDFKFNGPASNFRVTIELFSISRESYDFWSLIIQETDDTGGPYDTPPAPINGNVYNVNNAEDYALGFFNASSVTKASMNVVPR